MKPVKAKIVSILILTVLAGILVFKTLETAGGWEVYYYRLKVSFVSKGLHDYNFTLDDRLFLVFPNTTFQQACIIEANPGIKAVHEDSDGNLWAELDFPEKIGPGENFTALIVFRVSLTLRSLPRVSVESSGSLYDIPAELANYTSPSGVWNYESTGMKYIAELAAQIRGNDTNVLSIIAKAVEFISERVEYPYGEELRPPQYPNQTLPSPGLRGKGDCDDQSSLLITMLRSLGIPSYLQTGGIVSGSYSTVGSTWGGHLHIHSVGVGWHGWVEAYVPPWGWLPVDITYGYSQGEPLSPVIRSASARELVLESEKYSSTDFVAETKAEEERIRNSNVYIYLEEEVSKTLPASGHGTVGGNQQATNFIIMLALILAAVSLMLMARRLSKETRIQQHADYDTAFDDSRRIITGRIDLNPPYEKHSHCRVGNQSGRAYSPL